MAQARARMSGAARLVRLDEARHDAEDGAFAGAGRADDAHGLAAAHDEVHARQDAALAEGLVHVDQLDEHVVVLAGARVRLARGTAKQRAQRACALRNAEELKR